MERSATRHLVTTLCLVLALPAIAGAVAPIAEVPVDVFCNGRSETQTVSMAPINEVGFVNLVGERSCLCENAGNEEYLKSAIRDWALSEPGSGREGVEQCSDLHALTALSDVFTQENLGSFSVEAGGQYDLVLSCYTYETIIAYCVSVRDIPRAEGEGVAD